MSQVIITNDNLKTLRQNSAEQEHKIDREGEFAKWRRDDITGFDPVETLAGVVMAPLAVLFWLLALTSKVAIYAALLVSRFIGKIVGPMKS